jgi:hypothetical protein
LRVGHRIKKFPKHFSNVPKIFQSTKIFRYHPIAFQNLAVSLMCDRSIDMKDEKNPSEFSDDKSHLSDVHPMSKTSSSPRRGFDETPPIPKTGLPFISQHQGPVQMEIGPPIASISVF